MKTERIEFVAPPGLKDRLQKEAAQANISVAELIRQRFEPSNEEIELKKLTSELQQATTEARRELKQAVEKVDTLISDLQSRRKKAELEAA
jgi:ABC-type transporter Mla subunit MlaD